MRFSEWLAQHFGPGEKWVVAQRLTPRLRERGYTVCVSEAAFRVLETQWASGVSP